jgi:hypothetical protein
MALYNGVVCHFQVVYGLVYKFFNARFGVLKGSYPSDNTPFSDLVPSQTSHPT